MANNYHKHKTRLNKPIRITIMLSLILLFFIITPLIIFYASGYTYNFSEHRIKKTGVLSIDIKPKDSQIWLNSVLIKKKIPIRLSNKVPGTYNLKIEKEGYKTWEKDIVINSNQTTYIKDITLIKENLPLRILENIENIIDIYGNNGEKFLILAKNENLFEIYSYESETEKTSLLLRFNSEKKPEITISPFLDFAYIETIQDNKKKIFLLDGNNPEEEIRNLIFNTEDEPELEWLNDTKTPLYIKNNNLIYKITNSNETEFTISKEDVWFIDQSENLWFLNDKLFLQNKNDEEKKYYLNDKIEKIIDINEDRIIANSDKETIIYQIESGQISKKSYIPGTDLHYLNDEWLVNSSWEINIIHKDGTNELINRGGYKILDLAMFDEDGTYLIKTSEKLLAFNSGYFITSSLLENSEIKNILTEPKKRRMFFFAKIGNQNGIFELDY